MVSQHCGGKKEERKVEGMRRLHRLEQSQNPFSLPRIDQLVDATAGHPRISFLDAFQGYHQIPLALNDQEKMSFVTPIGNCHYKMMPFGLKNVGSTYQRMMTKIFEAQMGKILKCI